MAGDSATEPEPAAPAAVPEGVARAGEQGASEARDSGTGEAPRTETAFGFRVAATGRAGLLLGSRYEVRGFLSRGATSKVYLGHDQQTGSPVAIKILRSAARAKPGLRERFEQEACVGLRIDHESVVRVLAAEVPASGLCYIVMEPVLGESLGQLLRHGMAWAFDVRLRLARWAAEAVDAVHRAGVLHRDIKPDNFLVLGDREAPTGLKLLDLGMATDGADAAEDHDRGQVLGTAEYMAPEQILAEPVDARSDVYSFGVLLFRLFTEHLPFEDTHLVDTLRHQLFSPAPPPSWVADGMDDRLEGVILTALCKHPDNRYPTMAALLGDLAALASGGQPVLVPRRQDPDAYVPSTDRGRGALRSLAVPFGEYAKVYDPK